MIFKLIFAILTIYGLTLYRKNMLKCINLEKQNSESVVICFGYDKISNLIMISVYLDLILGVVSNPGEKIAKIVVSLGSIILGVGIIIYFTKVKIRSTVIIRKNDLIVFVNGKEIFTFDEIKAISIEVTENPYVYLITLTLNNRADYKITGRDQYEMNKVVRLINRKINNKTSDTVGKLAGCI